MYRKGSLLFHISTDYFKYSLYDFLVILYFAHKLLPAFGYYMPSIIYLGLFAILFLLTINNLSYKNFTSLLPIIMVSVMEFADYIIDASMSSVPLFIYGELQQLLYILVVLKYMQYNKKMNIQRLFNIVVCLYVITAITTIIGCVSNPEASRLLALGTSTDFYVHYTKLNIGGFSFVYELILLTPLFIYMLKRKRINRFLGIALVVLIGIVAIVSEYSTALLLYVFTIVVLFFIDVTPRKIISIGVIGMLSIVVFAPILSEIISTLSRLVNSEIVSERLDYIAATLMGNTAVESIAGERRLALYAKPLQAFAESWGIGLWTGQASGGHSFILDNIGCYGYTGILVIVIFLRGVFKMFLRPYREKDYFGYMIWGGIMAIIMMLLNPKTNLFYLVVVELLFGQVMMEKEDEYEIVVGGQ